MDFLTTKIIPEKDLPDKITRKKGIPLFLGLFVKNHIFAYLTLKWTHELENDV